MSKTKIVFPEDEKVIFSPEGKSVHLDHVPEAELQEIRKKVESLLANNQSKFITEETLSRINNAIAKVKERTKNAKKDQYKSFGTTGNKFDARMAYID